MDWNSAKELMGLTKDVATIVLPLLGVLVGARLAGRAANQNWLREKRLEAYVALIDKLMEIDRYFGVELKTAKFMPGDDLFDSDVQTEWLGKLMELDALEMRVRVVGGELTERYHGHIYTYRREMNLARSKDGITAEEWEAIGVRSQYLTYQVEYLARRDLAVSRIGRVMRLALPKKKPKPMTYEEWAAA